MLCSLARSNAEAVKSNQDKMLTLFLWACGLLGCCVQLSIAQSFNLYPNGLDPVKLSTALNISTDCLAALCVFTLPIMRPNEQKANAAVVIETKPLTTATRRSSRWPVTSMIIGGRTTMSPRSARATARRMREHGVMR